MKSLKYSVSPNGIYRVAEMPGDQQFTFYAGDNSYSVNRSLACFISPRILSQIQLDPTASSITINSRDEKHEFDQFVSLMKGKSIQIDTNNVDYILSVASFLQNQEIIDEIMRADTAKLTTSNVIKRVLMKRQFNTYIDQEVEYIASHFNELPANQLEKLDFDTLECILMSPQLMINSEDELFQFICQLIKCKGNEFVTLLVYLNYENLSQSEMEIFVNSIPFEFMNAGIWESITKRLVLKVVKDISRSNEQPSLPTKKIVQDIEEEFQYRGIPLEGIFAHLNKKYGGNIHEKGVIGITSSGDEDPSRPPHKVVDSKWGGHWSSSGLENSWLCFDFKTQKVSLTDYTLLSRRFGGNFLISWVVQGSNDLLTWEDLDRHVNCHDLNGAGKIKTFSCKKSNKYRYIRVMMLEKNSGNSFHFNISGIELFGTLSLPQV